MSTRFLAPCRALLVFSLCCTVFAQTLLARADENLALPRVDVATIETSRDAANADATSATSENATGENALPALPDAPTPEVFVEPLSVPTPTPVATPTPLSTRSPAKTSIAQSQKAWNNTDLSVLARQLKLPLPLPAPRIVILKSQRRLELWNGGQLIKTYRVALGGNPVGAKSRQHDSRTPEGHFRICTRNAVNSAFHIFLGLSYPDVPDAARGVNTGAISWREYALIQRKLASRGAPLWETRLGGWVGIHGGTGSPFAQKQAQKRGRNDWTAGCIALTDWEIEELYSATKMGTPVWIRP